MIESRGIYDILLGVKMDLAREEAFGDEEDHDALDAMISDFFTACLGPTRTLFCGYNESAGTFVFGKIGCGTQPCKVKRLLSLLCVYEVGDNFWGIVSERVTRAVLPMVNPEKIAIVTGADIVRYYYEGSYDYSVDLGTMGSSCMRYENCRKYFDLYSKNPKVCSMAIIKSGDTGKIKARALIWKLMGGRTFMDRQYASNINIGQLRKYAEEQGWVMWTDRGCFYDSERKEALKELDLLQVQLGEHTYKNFPYLDSLPYFDTTRNVLSAKMEDLLKPSKIYFLNGTSGLYSATLIYVADYLGVIRNRGDMLELHDGRFALGSECGPARGRNGNYLMTELVNVGGIYYHIDDAPEIVTYLGRNYTTDMCIRTSALTYYVGEDLWVPKTEVITHSGRTLIKSECVYRGDGLYHRTELINSVFDLSTGELVDGVPAEQTLYVQRLPFKVKGGLVTWPNGQICGGFAFVPAGTDVRPQDITGYIMECGVLIDTGLLPRDFTGRLNWEIKFYERRKKAADARDKRSQDSTQDPVAFSQLRENDCIPGAVGGPVGFVMYEGQAREPVCVGEEEEE